MSRAVWMECDRCNSTSPERNKGEATFREAWLVRDTIRRLYAAIEAFDASTVDLRVEIGGLDADVVRWVRDHADHEIGLHDEYGRSLPLEIPS